MRQRVKVAQAIVHDPAVLVLDEPLTGLDPRQRQDMVALFRRLGSEGRCVIVSSHVLDEVERLGSQVLVMSQGRLAAAGDFRELRALMDDRPMRIRVRTDRPRELAGALLEAGNVVGVRLDGDEVLELDTTDARRAVPRARAGRARPRMLACSRCSRSTPTSRASSATWCSDERRRHRRRGPGSPAHARLAPRALPAAAAHADHRSAPARHRWRSARCRILIGLFARLDDDSAQAAADAVSAYGLGILVPLATLWLGTSAIGDLVEDRLLVYLWLKPVPRWQLPAAAVLATVTVVVPLTALPLAASALVAGAGDVACAALLAASLAALAYAGLFVAAGLWFRRAVWWGSPSS